MTILPTLALRSFVGFDNFFNELESISNQKQSSFPAHDIVRISDDEYEITLAVSGFNKKDINKSIKFYGNCEYSSYLKKLISWLLNPKKLKMLFF